jgi:hypothetical protein
LLGSQACRVKGLLFIDGCNILSPPKRGDEPSDFRIQEILAGSFVRYVILKFLKFLIYRFLISENLSKLHPLLELL